MIYAHNAFHTSLLPLHICMNRRMTHYMITLITSWPAQMTTATLTATMTQHNNHTKQYHLPPVSAKASQLCPPYPSGEVLGQLWPGWHRLQPPCRVSSAGWRMTGCHDEQQPLRACAFACAWVTVSRCCQLCPGWVSARMRGGRCCQW